jgi:hypothetical protein
MANNPQFTGEIGIHYPLHVLNRYSLPELIDLAERAAKTLAPFNFTRVWTNDNLEYRSVLASSAAILARLPVKLGTAVAVPYFRNPIDVAMAFATMSELAGGRDMRSAWDPAPDRFSPGMWSGRNPWRSWPSWLSRCEPYSPARV